MKNAKSKHTHYVKDKMWTTKNTIKDVKKESEIVALNSKIKWLEALLTNTNGDNPNFHTNSKQNNQDNLQSR